MYSFIDISVEIIEVFASVLRRSSHPKLSFSGTEALLFRVRSSYFRVRVWERLSAKLRIFHDQNLCDDL